MTNRDADKPAGTGPTEFQDLRERIVATREQMPKRLAQIATYAVDHADDVAFGTVASIAEAAGVPPSALVRFAQALGYRGFSDLQAVFQSRLRERPTSYDERLASLAAGPAGVPTAGALFDGFTAAAVASVEALRSRIDLDCLEAAAARLAAAGTIYLVGQRRSFSVVTSLAYSFAKLRVRTVLAGSPAGIDREVLRFAGPGDAALAVSFAPYASATVEYCRQLHGQSVPVVAVTDSPFSPLAGLASELFEVAETDFAGFRSLAATQALVTALAVAVAERRRAGAEKTAEKP